MPTKKNSAGTTQAATEESESDVDVSFRTGIIRAFGGAILFAVPMLMTTEMWWLGFSMDPMRLALFVILDVPLLVALSYYIGFETTTTLTADILDAFIAFAVGAIASAVFLVLFGVVTPGMSAGEIIGKIAVQAVPASIGAMLARSELGEDQKSEEVRRSAGYGGGLFLMGIGAVYLCANLAATDEVVLISDLMSPAQLLMLMILSLVIMHAFVRAVINHENAKTHATRASVFLELTVVGYGIAMLISLYMLWTFGRTDAMSASQILEAAIVLAFPASLGAGAARLILMHVSRAAA